MLPQSSQAMITLGEAATLFILLTSVLASAQANLRETTNEEPFDFSVMFQHQEGDSVMLFDFELLEEIKKVNLDCKTKKLSAETEYNERLSQIYEHFKEVNNILSDDELERVDPLLHERIENDFIDSLNRVELWMNDTLNAINANCSKNMKRLLSQKMNDALSYARYLLENNEGKLNEFLEMIVTYRYNLQETVSSCLSRVGFRNSEEWCMVAETEILSTLVSDFIKELSSLLAPFEEYPVDDEDYAQKRPQHKTKERPSSSPCKSQGACSRECVGSTSYPECCSDCVDGNGSGDESVEDYGSGYGENGDGSGFPTVVSMTGTRVMTSATPAVETTQNEATQEATILETTAQEETTQEATTQEETTQEATTQEATTHEATTQEETTQEGTTQEATTQELKTLPSETSKVETPTTIPSTEVEMIEEEMEKENGGKLVHSQEYEPTDSLDSRSNSLFDNNSFVYILGTLAALIAALALVLILLAVYLRCKREAVAKPFKSRKLVNESDAVEVMKQIGFENPTYKFYKKVNV